MGEHLCAVDSLPIESIKRESVCVVPVDFGRQEIIDAAAFHYLRDSRAVAEGIGQPEAVRGEIEIFSRESLTPEELSDHRLAGGYVAVALDPHAAVGLVSALFDLLLNASEEVGIFAAQEVAVARGALDKFIFRILVHERELVRIGARALLDCLADMPEPRGVHMRMSDERGLRRIVAVFDGKRFFEIGLRSLESRHELAAVNIVGRLVYLFEYFFELVYDRSASERALRQVLDELNEGAQIEIELLDIIVLDADINALI